MKLGRRRLSTQALNLLELLAHAASMLLCLLDGGIGWDAPVFWGGLIETLQERQGGAVTLLPVQIILSLPCQDHREQPTDPVGPATFSPRMGKSYPLR